MVIGISIIANIHAYSTGVNISISNIADAVLFSMINDLVYVMRRYVDASNFCYSIKSIY